MTNNILAVTRSELINHFAQLLAFIVLPCRRGKQRKLLEFRFRLDATRVDSREPDFLTATGDGGIECKRCPINLLLVISRGRKGVTPCIQAKAPFSQALGGLDFYGDCSSHELP